MSWGRTNQLYTAVYQFNLPTANRHKYRYFWSPPSPFLSLSNQSNLLQANIHMSSSIHNHQPKAVRVNLFRQARISLKQSKEGQPGNNERNWQSYIQESRKQVGKQGKRILEMQSQQRKYLGLENWRKASWKWETNISLSSPLIPHFQNAFHVACDFWEERKSAGTSCGNSKENRGKTFWKYKGPGKLEKAFRNWETGTTWKALNSIFLMQSEEKTKIKIYCLIWESDTKPFP